MDPTSRANTELGTQEFPYKTLNAAFLDILHASIDDPVEVLVKAGTVNPVNSPILILAHQNLHMK